MNERIEGKRWVLSSAFSDQPEICFLKGDGRKTDGNSQHQIIYIRDP